MVIKIPSRTPHNLYMKPFPGSPLCFRFKDVDGDGNCNFHAIAKSPLCPFKDYVEVKRAMSDRLARGSPDRERLAPIFKYYMTDSEPIDVEVWRRRIVLPREWGNDFDMVIYACLFGTNITSYNQVAANCIVSSSGF